MLIDKSYMNIYLKNKQDGKMNRIISYPSLHPLSQALKEAGVTYDHSNYYDDYREYTQLTLKNLSNIITEYSNRIVKNKNYITEYEKHLKSNIENIKEIVELKEEYDENIKTLAILQFLLDIVDDCNNGFCDFEGVYAHIY